MSTDTTNTDDVESDDQLPTQWEVGGPEVILRKVGYKYEFEQFGMKIVFKDIKDLGDDILELRDGYDTLATLDLTQVGSEVQMAFRILTEEI